MTLADIAAAREVGVAERPGEVVEVRGELVGGDVGDDQPHAAADVVADRLRDDEAVALGHGADRDAAAAVQIGGEHDPAERAGRVTFERDACDARTGLAEGPCDSLADAARGSGDHNPPAFHIERGRHGETV